MGEEPDWVKLAEAFGWAARCDDKGELVGAMRTTLETTVRCWLTSAYQDENCFPMIPAGAAARDMVG